MSSVYDLHVYFPAPTGAPGRFTNTLVESRSLTVVWGTVPCSQQRGPITGYTLRYSNGTSIVNIIGVNNRQYVLTGLTPFTSYSVQVAAVNDGGTGPFSDSLTVETQQEGEWTLLHCSCCTAMGATIIMWYNDSYYQHHAGTSSSVSGLLVGLVVGWVLFAISLGGNAITTIVIVFLLRRTRSEGK